jgi:hypothetical protein
MGWPRCAVITLWAASPAPRHDRGISDVRGSPPGPRQIRPAHHRTIEYHLGERPLLLRYFAEPPERLASDNNHPGEYGIELRRRLLKAQQSQLRFAGTTETQLDVERPTRPDPSVQPAFRF